jgi:Flp pilus assembly protein TadD
MTVRSLAAMLALGLVLGFASGCASFQAARLYRSGSAALEHGEAERAIADLERAAALAPEASEVQNHLGLAYAAAGRDAEATRAFRRAVELDCDNAAAHENLAVAERRGPGAP